MINGIIKHDNWRYVFDDVEAMNIETLNRMTRLSNNQCNHDCDQDTIKITLYIKRDKLKYRVTIDG